MRAYIGLGSNLGDRAAYLERATEALRAVDAGLERSAIYETAPVGGPDDQGPYLNCVVRLDSELTPLQLLDLARRVESDAGRIRTQRWGPRTLDVDILLVEGVELDGEELVLPHPRIRERAFVLAPLEDLDAGLVPVGWRDLLGGADAVSRGAAARRRARVRVVESAGDLVGAVRDARRAGAGVGLVPTMGALHDGHRSLLEQARARHELVVMSVFVNPLQFDRSEDLARYPCDLESDTALAAEVGIDVCFAPTVDEMFASGDPIVRVDPGPLGELYEGASRPGHFAGVATVVTKLLALAAPDAAYFGEKDYQQLVIVRRLVADLSLPLEIVACPTVRELDGLAMSSRNRRMSPHERSAATVLYRALLAGRDAVVERFGRDEVEEVMARVVGAEPLAKLDYAVVVTPELAPPPAPLEGVLRLLVAATVGAVRVIDNVEAVA